MIASGLDMLCLHMLEHVGLVVSGVGANQAGPRTAVQTSNLGPDCRLTVI